MNAKEVEEAGFMASLMTRHLIIVSRPDPGDLYTALLHIDGSSGSLHFTITALFTSNSQRSVFTVKETSF